MFLPACIGLNSTKTASLDVSCHAKHSSWHVSHGHVCTLVLTDTRHVRDSSWQFDKSTTAGQPFQVVDTETHCINRHQSSKFWLVALL